MMKTFSTINDDRDLMSIVAPFHLAHPGYSFMYVDGSMVKVSLGHTPPNVTVVKSPLGGEILCAIYETAYVGFDKKEGKNLSFKFNKHFAETLNSKEIAFVFAHESLHVLLDHGRRGNAFLKTLPIGKRSRGVLNKAMDVCINEILMKEVFYDDLEYMPILKELCNLETIFYSKGATHVQPDRDFIYYYNEIIKLMEESEGEEPGEGNVVFGDAIFEDDDIDEIEDFLNDILDKAGNPDESNIKDILKKKSKSQGSGSVGYEEVVSRFEKMSMQEAVNRYVKPRNMSKIDMNSPAHIKYNWYKINRRTVGMGSNGYGSHSGSMSVPVRDVHTKNKKMKVVVYADVSGSVASYTEKFLGIINVIDTNISEVVPYVWADGVGLATFDAKSQKYKWKNVGGGTNIRAVLNHYTSEYEDDRVDSVIVLTDGGYEDIIKEKLGRYFDNTKWIFLMTEGQMPDKILDKSVSVEIDWSKKQEN